MDLTTVNRREIAWYLDIRNGKVNAELSALIEDCLLELNEKVTPKHVFRVYPLEISLPSDLEFAGIRIHSRDLAYNLKGCDEVLLFAATIGQGADFLIRRYEKIKMSRAVVCQACSAAMIEAYIEEINENWKQEYEAKGRALRPRYSCGYGDFELTHQQDFIRVLEAEKRLGIYLNDAMLMQPTKSVTAVIGIGDSEK